jgi:hypothetical protein
MSQNNIILSFDVGIIHLSYCLLQKKDNKWDILEWSNIDLSNKDNGQCNCGNKASYTNIIDDNIHYYCKIHKRNINMEFNELFNVDTTHFCHCNKKSKFCKNYNYYCNLHAKQVYKKLELKEIKIKNTKHLVFDDVKYKLMMELEKRPHLLKATYVVIENQPSFKNPRMKSIASTIYDYYLIRGIFDKNINNSLIKSVKFMAPSNKLKLADENDCQELIKLKGDESKTYKLTKALGIKYCGQLISHLDEWKSFFNSNKKKDDLADSFLQGVYFYTYKMR